MQLTNSQLRHLRGLSHHISPVVIVAGKGLTDNVMAEVEQALEHHELIKVKLRADRATRAAWAEQIGRATG
ncbi:MAG: YhbY family RNA-binding protein, partial [Gammaproteobacteria bacterium]